MSEMTEHALQKAVIVADPASAPVNVFLSFHFPDSPVVERIYAHLAKQPSLHCYYYLDDHRLQAWQIAITDAMDGCNRLIVFIGQKLGDTQAAEVDLFARSGTGPVDQRILFVMLPGAVFPKELVAYERCLKTPASGAQNGELDEAQIIQHAKEIAQRLTGHWVPPDGLPAKSNVFEYEKDIIDFYTRRALPAPGTSGHEALLAGIPRTWPDLCKVSLPEGVTAKKNPEELQKIVGRWRPQSARVLAAALSSYHEAGAGGDVECCMLRKGLSFPEAGPRQFHVYPHAGTLNVAVLVSGGIAPGINAVIDGIASRHYLYAAANGYRVNVLGLRNGFSAFDFIGQATIALAPQAIPGVPSISTSTYANDGGSMIGTSRVDELIDINSRPSKLNNVVAMLYGLDVHILYVIGGDGSMKAAHALHHAANRYAKDNGIKKELSIVGVPKTMDNDILWVWQSFGFLSAVEKAREVIEDLSTEVTSNPRLCVAQLFGSDSGFVVSHAVLASRSGICDAALIPEVDFSVHELATWLAHRMVGRAQVIPSGLVVMAETAIPTDAAEFRDDPDVRLNEWEKGALDGYLNLRKQGCHIQGQTDDHLRKAGLKIVSRGLQKLIKAQGLCAIPDWRRLRVVTSEPRHLLRAIRPSCTDIIIGQRLGALAVDNALAGYTDFMISQWLTEYVLVPLDLVVLGRKRIPPTGVFWRSVVAKTGFRDEDHLRKISPQL